ncbi:MAG TPA: hypothetical protein VK797_22830 [Tepidisphaeraceae bacterium]|jgi:hypothetical protein|nr:hypothetical protein [Tepidisphaeraceae bacterium]
MPRLAILICHLNHRVGQLQRLMDRLSAQCSITEISIFIHTDAGEKPVGQKRNELLRGPQEWSIPYCSFIDDDDLVTDDYCPRILTALQENPDVVGLEGLLVRPAPAKPETFIHSMQYSRWFETGPPGSKTYFRPPNHLNPVKTELAIATGFKPLTHGEDRDYSHRLRPLLKSEVFLEGPVYHYFAP